MPPASQTISRNQLGISNFAPQGHSLSRLRINPPDLPKGSPYTYWTMHRPPALEVRLRVAPCSASSDCAGDGVSGCPKPRILRRSCELVPESPRVVTPPVPPCDEPPGFPEFCVFRLCRRVVSPGCPGFPLLQRRLPVDLRVASGLAPSGGPGDLAPGCPGASIFRLRFS
jgi:hypothetical protein